MARPLFNRIVTAVTNHDSYFYNNTYCTGRECIFPLIKCTFAIRQLAYGMNGSFLDEYIQISERSSRMALDHFCEVVIEIYGPEFLRKPTFGCLYAFKGKYVRRDHGSNPFILLEVVASQDLWKWHAFFGVAGSNNVINVLYQSPLFNDLKTGRASEITFMANGVSYLSGYYLVDGIYSELAPLVKTIPEPADDDHKRILYKQKHESARKYVERAFGVLKKKLAVLANPTRALKKERIVNMIKLLGILERFTQHKMNMDESIQVSCNIDKLPPSWKDFKHTLKHNKEKLNLVGLGNIDDSLRAQDNDKPKGSNVFGPSVVNMAEHNNSIRKPGHLKKDCKGGKVSNKANGSDTNGSVDGSTNSLKGQNIFNKSLQVYYVTYVSEVYFVQDDDVTLNIINDNSGSAFMSASKLNDSILSHARLDHVHFKRMQDMSKDGLIPTFDMDTEKWNKKYFVTFIDDAFIF
uniref:GAG-pre-integrase domain-containing protein n=1 Tax=Tanacetum cinerariifolium TaxID=118510 RepID=A0A6L2MSB9_TANCI|nr:hypothetical protein [Tanacetum cinerariifolium]